MEWNRMETASNAINWRYNYTGYFNGRPIIYCDTLDEITLKFGEMNTSEMIESKDFQMLWRAGIEVHRDSDDSFLEDRRRRDD